MAARLVFVALAFGVFGAACSTGPNHQNAPIGEACQKNTDCGTTTYKCLLTAVVDGNQVVYPDGYCTLPCAAAASDCPSDSTCVLGQCRRLCADGSDCRVAEGYACVPGPANGGSGDFCELPGALQPGS